MNKTIITSIIVLIILSSPIMALGIGPVQIYRIFEPGTEDTIKLRIFNNQAEDMILEVEVRGELAEYFEFDEEFTMKSDQEEQTITLTVNYPAALPPGPHYTDIIITEKPAGKETVVAVQSHVSKLRVQVPYTGPYAEAKMTINPGINDAEFFIDIYNFYSDYITAKAMIHIEGNGITRTLMTAERMVSPMSEQRFVQTAKLEAGEYHASATIEYADKSIELADAFIVGLKQIDIIDIYVEDFKQGEVAPVHIRLRNQWPVPITGVHGEMMVDSDRIATETFTIDKDKEIVAYWDSKGKESGIYNADAVFYYDGLQTSVDFTIEVKEKRQSYIWVIILFLLITAYISWRLYRRTKRFRGHSKTI